MADVKITPAVNTQKAAIKQQITWARNRLEDIKTNGSTYTAAQVRTAVVDIAKILEVVAERVVQIERDS